MPQAIPFIVGAVVSSALEGLVIAGALSALSATLITAGATLLTSMAISSPCVGEPYIA